MNGDIDLKPGSLDARLKQAFDAGRARGFYAFGRGRRAPDFEEWRRSLTPKPEPRTPLLTERIPSSDYNFS